MRCHDKPDARLELQSLCSWAVDLDVRPAMSKRGVERAKLIRQ